MITLMVVLGAAVGAPLRHLTHRFVQVRLAPVFPWGTFAANVAACLALGLATGAAVAGAAPGWVQALVGTGFCGSLSTYSTFALETLQLDDEQGERRAAVVNVVASVVVGLAAAFAGAGLARAFCG